MYKTNSSAGGLHEVHTWDPRLWINCWMGRFWKKWFFDQWGMGLGMFWWSNRPTLLNLSLIYKILKICEKKLSTLSTGNLPSVTTLSLFLQKNVVGAETFPVLKVLNFFHRSSLFYIWGLSLEGWAYWTIRTCLNLYPIDQKITRRNTLDIY